MDIPGSLVDALLAGELVPFIGSGVSLDVSWDHFPGWNELFEKMALKLDAEGKGGLGEAVLSTANAGEVFIAAEMAEKHLGIGDFSTIIEETYYYADLPDGSTTELPEAIWSLRPKLVVTTNYDEILEWTNSRGRTVCNSDAEIASLLKAPTADQPWIWHLHGLARRKNTLILSPNQYEELYGTTDITDPDYKAALDRLEDILGQRTLLFIGFGMRDKYVLDTIGRVLKRFQGYSGKHYALLKEGEESEKLWDEFGIQAISYEDHGPPLIKLVRRLGQNLPDEPVATTSPLASADPSAEEDNDELEPLPELPPLPKFDESLILNRFIGRRGMLERLKDLFRGLMERAEKIKRPEGTAAKQLQWIHGFGGMGKSWYMRRSYIAAQEHRPRIHVALVDWDHTDWRDPLNDHPSSARNLMEPIATRLAQVCGVDTILPFREAKHRVAKAGIDHQRLQNQFNEQLGRLQREGDTDDAMLVLLRDRNIIRADPNEQKRQLNLLQTDRLRMDELFANWCETQATGVGDFEAASRPTNLLVSGLVRSLKNGASNTPLLLMLDTCEVVSRREDLDFWLRRIVGPLCDDTTPILIQIVSRLRPDAGAAPGSRKGWLEISDRLFDVVDFNADDTQLSRAEIQSGLERLSPPVEDAERLSSLVAQATLGVPLAVGSLFDMHRRDGTVLSELENFDVDAHSLDESEAVQAVIEEVAGRMLLHLRNSRRPEANGDLRAIVALALLPRMDHEILAELWPDQQVRARLIELAGRYSLLANGDLHLRVRDYLRRHWRQGLRPDCFDEILLAVSNIVDRLPVADDKSFGSAEWISSRLRSLNVSIWQKAWAAANEGARLLAVALAYDQHVPEVAELLEELARFEEQGSALAAPLTSLTSWQGDVKRVDKRIIKWLSESERQDNWNDLESASLTVVCELRDSPTSADEGIEKFLRLETAVSTLEEFRTPRQSELADSFFSIAFETSPGHDGFKKIKKQHAIQWPVVVERAYRRCLQYNSAANGAWNNLGNLLMRHLELYGEAEQAYRRAIELDSKFAAPWNGLGNLLMIHLGRYDESEQAYRRAIELDSKFAAPWNGLGNLLMDHLERYGEAEQAFRRAIELDSKFAAPWNGLGNLLMIHLGRYDESEQAFGAALNLDVQFDPARLNLVFLQRDILIRPEAARKSLSQMLDKGQLVDVQSLHEALFAAYDRKWYSTELHLIEAEQQADGSIPASNWDDWCRASAVLLHLGFGEEFLDFLCSSGIDQRLSSWFAATKACHLTPDEEVQFEDPKTQKYFHYIRKWKAILPQETAGLANRNQASGN